MSCLQIDVGESGGWASRLVLCLHAELSHDCAVQASIRQPPTTRAASGSFVGIQGDHCELAASDCGTVLQQWAHLD